MKTYMSQILGSEGLGTNILALLSASWAPGISTTFGSTIHRYFDFSDEHKIASLAATPAHTKRNVA
jgi:hypothetical protein